VQIDQVTKDVAESIGLGKPQGALVRSVEAGSPADKAGIEAGDIITKFNGQAIDKATDLPRLVGNTKPGTKLDAHRVPPRRLARPGRADRRVRAREAARAQGAGAGRPPEGLARRRSRWAWWSASSPTRRRRS
jgi:predicted metalloprotease with PDZ domain